MIQFVWRPLVVDLPLSIVLTNYQSMATKVIAAAGAG